MTREVPRSLLDFFGFKRVFGLGAGMTVASIKSVYASEDEDIEGLTYFGDAALLHESGTVNQIALFPYQSSDGHHIKMFGASVKDSVINIHEFIDHLYSIRMDFYYTNTLIDEVDTRRLKTGMGDELLFCKGPQGFVLHKSFSVVF